MKDNNSNTKNSFHNLITKFLAVPISFVTSIVVARFLGPELRGVFSFLTLMITFAIPILSLGSGAGITYFIRKKNYSNQESLFSILFIGFLKGALGSFLIYLLWYFELLGDVGRLITLNELSVVMISLPFNSLFFFLNRYSVGNDRFIILNKLTIFQSLLHIVGITVFVGFLDLEVKGAITSVLCYNIVTFTVLLSFSIKGQSINKSINTSFLKDVYSYGFKGWWGDLALKLNFRIDQIILGVYSSYSLGLYGMAVLIAEVLWIFPDAFGPVLMNKIIGEKEEGKRNVLIYKLHRLTFWGIFICGLIGAVGGYFMIPILLGDKYQGSVLPFLLMLPGILTFSSAKVITKLFSGTGKIGFTSVVIVVGTVVSVSLYIFLIPKYNAVGAAIGSSTGYTIAGITALFIARSQYNLSLKEMFIPTLSDIKWVKSAVLKS